MWIRSPSQIFNEYSRYSLESPRFSRRSYYFTELNRRKSFSHFHSQKIDAFSYASHLLSLCLPFPSWHSKWLPSFPIASPSFLASRHASLLISPYFTFLYVAHAINTNDRHTRLFTPWGIHDFWFLKTSIREGAEAGGGRKQKYINKIIRNLTV